jgi:hypothetical protein
MERVRIYEMRRAHQERTGKKLLNKEVAKKVFKDDDIALATGQERLSEWDHGKGFSTMRPRHIIALAKAYGVQNIDEVFEA